ncbi:MAG: ABC transporter substrate-binding protein [Alphaproteobacteria bacterium]
MVFKVARRFMILAVAVAGVVAASGASGQTLDVEAAKKEGKVVIYGTMVPKVMAEIEKGFQAKYGIKIEYWRADATKVIDRVLTEWRSGRPAFDVVIGARGAIALGKHDNVYAKFSPASAAKFPSKYRDPDGQLTAWRLTPVGVLYNTDMVKASEAPKTLDDLLDSRWMGKISMPDPSRHASTAQYLWNLEQVKKEKWMDFVRALAKQKPLLLESYSTVPSAIVRGESALGITYIQYTVQTKGPINFAPIDKVFADPSDAALSGKAINPNAAKVFIDYLCSEEGQKRVAETGEFVLAPGVFPAIKGADKVVSSMLMMRDVSAEQLAKLQNEFRPLFLAK